MFQTGSANSDWIACKVGTGIRNLVAVEELSSLGGKDFRRVRKGGIVCIGQDF